jgi:hypothetical protein
VSADAAGPVPEEDGRIAVLILRLHDVAVVDKIFG